MRMKELNCAIAKIEIERNFIDGDGDKDIKKREIINF